MFRFIHAADLHLDTPFDGIGKVSEEVQRALRDASLEAFDALIELAIERAVAFVVIAGDVYDGAQRGIRAQMRFLAGLRRLDEAGIRTFIIHGNHDPLDGWSAIGPESWPAGVTIFGSDDVEAIPVEIDGGPAATLYGMSYPTREVSENLALRYRRQAGPAGPGVHIGVLHGNVGSNAEHGSYSPCTLGDLVGGQGMDYWALGHIHRRGILHAGSPWVVYAGNLQGRSPKPSELGEKGVYVVTVDGGAIQEPEFVPLDRTRFVRFTVDIDDIPDLPTLVTRLQDLAHTFRAFHLRRGLLLRAVLTGRGRLDADLRRPDALTHLRTELRDAAAGLAPFLWWEDIRAETQPELDLDAIRGRGDFAADILRLSDDLAAAPEAYAQFLDRTLADLQRGAVARATESIAATDADPALLREATHLALALLASRDAP